MDGAHAAASGSPRRRLPPLPSARHPAVCAAGVQGTIENAVEQLELYRNLLDNRVVSRFDAALARHDLPAMADCARTMAEFRCVHVGVCM